MAAAIQHIHFESRKRGPESSFLPVLDGKIVRRRVPKRILRQTGPITAHVRSVQVQNAHIETFDAPNLSLDVGN